MNRSNVVIGIANTHWVAGLALALLLLGLYRKRIVFLI